MNIATNLEKMFSLEGKIIVITGGAGGICSVMAKGMAMAGGNIVLCDIAEDALGKVVEEIKCEGGLAWGCKMDMSSLDSINECVDQIIKKYGRIDVLVNGAGINQRDEILDVKESTYDRIMNINLKGLYFLSQSVGEHMKKEGKGNVINIASHNSVGMLGGCSVYGATKSAVTAFTRSIAVEWAKYGIRCNAIAPGHIQTALTTPTWEHPTRSVYLKERIAMGRPGTPEEVVGCAVMLASDASIYMSGQMVHIDGGCLAGGQPWDLSQ
ncbi:hypothetical protein AN639_01415 [Candidatus Epulonipiscium fishelsonii]|uniref:Uncharacterized protein n=1 Tax=Candidatus Epulonipiscium fishelsonii TaxID=77094 RepID=A0ACC8XBU5_9FIRM|nr:hypothetical protein AN639_01415 [Epulopiscium sp. SCG-B05WGA-EpuloA1]ONI40012.1 hypothetical protein AN396_06590 [Epulopiscium sp. SCG-B11WGA-EpuloA1]